MSVDSVIFITIMSVFYTIGAISFLIYNYDTWNYYRSIKFDKGRKEAIKCFLFPFWIIFILISGFVIFFKHSYKTIKATLYTIKAMLHTIKTGKNDG